MFRAREPQRQIFSARNQYLNLIDPESFYALLAKYGEQLFSDYEFEDMYCQDNGRPCIPPSSMFNLLMLQMLENCSDYKAIERSRFDIRWLAVLDLQIGERLCGRSTFVEFRARVHLNEKTENQFKAILVLAKGLGILKGQHLDVVALDTTPILGRGAVKDTYNLIADGIRKLVGVLARLEGISSEQWAKSNDLSRYWEASSLKGEAKIDWSNEGERRVFLNGLVADAGRLLLEAGKRGKTASKEDVIKIQDASALLKRLIAQDTEPASDGPKEAKKRKREKKGATTSPEPPAEDGTNSSEGNQAGPAESSPAATATQASESSANSTTAASQSPAATATSASGPAGQASDSPETTPTSANEGNPSCPAATAPTATAAQPESPVKSTTPASQPSAAKEASASGPEDQASAADVLGQMVQIREGVAPDRIISVHDEEMRHGRKSASNRFDGYKQTICVDTASKLILSIDVIPGNAPDNRGALNLVKQAELNTGMRIKKALADCAYGDGATRQEFADAEIDLSAKVPSPPANDPFHKGRFILDLTNKIATCPVGQTTSDYDFHTHKRGVSERFCFSEEVCQACPHKGDCLRNSDEDRSRGRTIALHPQEALLQRARQRQADPAFREDIKARQVVEHRQACTVQLGGRQARYVGQKKTKFQSLMIAMVANLKLMAKAISVACALAVLLCHWATIFDTPSVRGQQTALNEPREVAPKPATWGLAKEREWHGLAILSLSYRGSGQHLLRVIRGHLACMLTLQRFYSAYCARIADIGIACF